MNLDRSPPTMIARINFIMYWSQETPHSHSLALDGRVIMCYYIQTIKPPLMRLGKELMNEK
jgi:hypothetical protein